MNINSKWERWLAVGCSHGDRISKSWEKAVLDFKASYKPKTIVHLGDFVDTAAFRSGAKGTNDETASIPQDFDAGMDFLQKLAPNHIFIGNHENRLYKLANHHNAIISRCASSCIEEIDEMALKLKATLTPYHIKNGWRRCLGSDLLCGHGFMYGEQALRDHAEAYGKCLIAHLHRAGEAPGRRLGAAIGYCVGMGADEAKMTYAHERRATLAWSNGFAFGEHNGKETVVWIAKPTSTGEWRLPI